ncbi:sigma-70 family RNA polymerase sigma factor [Streptomyces sp. NPDC005407]|uniref:RNA polymerase sigma factor n=1 Tax=Streptomyces sp. NPDC005407 TaxID=3155340 RepID=UPI0033A0A0A8
MTQQRIPAEAAEQVAALWDREAAALMRYALFHTGGDRCDAGDLVQQVFMTAAETWSFLSTLAPHQQRKWLRRTCRNKWIDQIRRAKNLQEKSPDLADLYLRDEPDTADIVIHRAALERCWEVIRTFPARRRQIAILHFYEQYPALRIADLLGIQCSGVRKHISQAKEALWREVGPFLERKRASTATSEKPEEARA